MSVCPRSSSTSPWPQVTPNLRLCATAGCSVRKTGRCSNGSSLQAQRDLFEAALEALAELRELINQVLEVTEDDDGEISITVYELPAPEDPR
jgi:hypothetical protein